MEVTDVNSYMKYNHNSAILLELIYQPIRGHVSVVFWLRSNKFRLLGCAVYWENFNWRSYRRVSFKNSTCLNDTQLFMRVEPPAHCPKKQKQLLLPVVVFVIFGCSDIRLGFVGNLKKCLNMAEKSPHPREKTFYPNMSCFFFSKSACFH